MEKTTMTERMFMEAIVGKVEEGKLEPEFGEFAEKRIAAIEEKRKKDAEKRAEKNAENEPLFDKIVGEYLGHEPVTATQIGELLEVSTQKASYLLRTLVAAGRADVTDIKGKKGKVKGYTARA